MKRLVFSIFVAAAQAVHNKMADVVSASNAVRIPDQYIVKLKDEVTSEQFNSHLNWLVQLSPPAPITVSFSPLLCFKC
jgi:hypothetical protein